jgi:hypothetical protein
MRIVKTCGCGMQYGELGWRSLQPVGSWDDAVEHFETRACVCGSSHSRSYCLKCWTETTGGAPHQCEAPR